MDLYGVQSLVTSPLYFLPFRHVGVGSIAVPPSGLSTTSSYHGMYCSLSR